MDPLRTAHLNAESPQQIHERVLLYRAHNATCTFLEYLPSGDGTCGSRELPPSDPLDRLSLLATTPFPGVPASGVQQLMQALRYFLFDLQNSMYDIVPHQGPPQTLSNMVFYRQYADGSCGVVVPVQRCATGPSARYPLSQTIRTQLAQRAREDEPRLLESFVASGNGYYLDALINRVIFNFRREIRDIEIQERLLAAPPHQQSAHGRGRRLHWSMVG